MNHRGILKSLFVFITCIVSLIFILFTQKSFSIYYPANIFYLFPLGIMVILYERKRQKTYIGWIKKMYWLVIILNIGILIYYLFQTMIQYMKFATISTNLSFYYLIIIWIFFLSSLFDCQNETSSLHDWLTIIVCIVITLVFYRYWTDANFLHNLLKISDQNSMTVQLSYKYVEQYYPLFIFGLLALIIQRNILRIKKN